MRNPIRAAGRRAIETIRSRLWPVPVVGLATALLLGFLIPGLDAAVDGAHPEWLNALIFNGDAGAARTVLDAISSSLITVTALTFSLTVVTLQLASSQFSPRLLRTFTKDLFVQVTLALFLGTFTFALTVLRSVRSSQESLEPFVPRISVTFCFVLAIASVVGLVLFLAHLTKQIRVETMLAQVRKDTRKTMSSTLTGLDYSGPRVARQPESHVVNLSLLHSGFLLSVSVDSVLAIAADMDAFVRVERMPGDFVVAGTAVASAWKKGGMPFTQDEHDALQRRLECAVSVGPERTGSQDAGFGLRQLVDVALKSLSPGINDPTTAVHALGHVSAVLSELARYRLGSVTVADEEEIVLAEFVRPTFDDYLDLAFTQPLHYGRRDTFVIARLFATLHDLATTCPPDCVGSISEQLGRLEYAVREESFGPTERLHHDRLAIEVRQALGHAATG